MNDRIAAVRRKSEINMDLLNANWREGKCSQTVVVNINDWARRLCFNGDTLAVGTFSGAVLVYDIPSSVRLAQFDGDGEQVPNPDRMEICAMAMSPDGDLVASGSVEGVVKVHCLRNSQCVFQTKLPGAPIKGLRFDPENRFLVAASETQVVQVRVGEWEQRIEVEMCNPDSVATVACMSIARADDGLLWYVYGLANGMVLVQSAGPGGALPESQPNTPDSPTDTPEPQQLGLGGRISFRPHPSCVTACDAHFEAGKLVLYTGCDNGEVAAWDLSQGRTRFRWSLLGHQGAVAALQSDGHKLVSGALDGTVRVWEVSADSGHPLYAISGHTAYMGSVQFEGGRLICDGTNNAVLMHDFLNVDDDTA